MMMLVMTASLSKREEDIHALNIRLSNGLRVILWHFKQHKKAMSCWDVHYNFLLLTTVSLSSATKNMFTLQSPMVSFEYVTVWSISF